MSVPHKCKLVVHDWISQPNSESVYDSAPELSEGDLHHGSTFDAIILLPEDAIHDIEYAAGSNIRPVFYLVEQ